LPPARLIALCWSAAALSQERYEGAKNMRSNPAPSAVNLKFLSSSFRNFKFKTALEA
jgi:hypothetical protein